MKEKRELKLPGGLRYSSAHVWTRPEGDLLVVGISDYAQDQLGGIVFVDLPSPGAVFKTGGEFGNVESVKAVNGLYMPVAGEVVEVNGTLDDDPAIINGDCYGAGWLLKIRPADPGEAAGLMEAEAYRASLG